MAKRLVCFRQAATMRCAVGRCGNRSGSDLLLVSSPDLQVVRTRLHPARSVQAPAPAGFASLAVRHRLLADVDRFADRRPTDTGYRVVGSGDYDGDGKADILWHHTTVGEVWMWRMDGAVRLSQTWVATVSDVGYEIVKR